MGFAVAYGVCGISIIVQSLVIKNCPTLLKRVLFLWGMACLLRVVSAVVLATHTDVDVHPIVLEMLWHVVWMLGCFSLSYFLIVSMKTISTMTGRRGNSFEVTHFVNAMNVVWVSVFILLSILDGLSSDWPRPHIQWFVWTCVMVYFLFGSVWGWFQMRQLPNARQSMQKMLLVMKIFLVLISSGLLVYTVFLPIIGVLRGFYPDTYTLTAEVVITSIAQSAFLCMGIGMQIGTRLMVVLKGIVPSKRSSTSRSIPFKIKSGPEAEITSRHGGSVGLHTIKHHRSNLSMNKDFKHLVRPSQGNNVETPRVQNSSMLCRSSHHRNMSSNTSDIMYLRAEKGPH